MRERLLGEGATVGVPTPPPPKKISLYGWAVCYFFLHVRTFATFSPYGGLSPCRRHFFPMGGAFFGLAPPSPTYPMEISAGAHAQAYMTTYNLLFSFLLLSVLSSV